MAAVLILILYAAAHYGARVWLDRVNSALLWVPAGLAVAVLAAIPRRRWPGYLAGFALVNIIFNISKHIPVGDSIIFLASTMVEMGAAAWLIHRWLHRDDRLGRVSDAVAVVVASVAGSVAGGAICASLLGPSLLISRTAFFFNWVISHYLAMVVLAPLVLLLTCAEPPSRSVRRPKAAERAALLVATALLTWTSFHVASVTYANLTSPYLLFVVIIWASIRCGMRETAIGSILITAVMIATFRTEHLAIRQPTFYTSLESAQQFLAVLVTTGLLLSAFAQDRSRAFSSATESEARFRLIFENAADPLALLKGGAFVFVNPPLLQLFGREVGEPVDGFRLQDFFSPPSWPEAQARVEACQVMPPASPVRWEAEGRRGAGEPVAMQVALAPFNHGEDRYLLVTFRDLTEQKQAEAARNALEERLRQSQKLEAVGRLAGGVAHDFNNILTGMILNLQVMELVRQVPEDLKPAIADLTSMVRRAAGITEQLLIFARKNVMRSVPLELNAVATDALKLVGRVLGENVALRTELGGPPLRVLGDAGMLQQVIVNLSLNARDAMPSGGELFIGAAAVRFDEAALERRAGRFAGLTVRDTGSGIAPEVLPRIFEPFFTTKDVGKGTGLGLAIVHSIVKQHGGWVEVESAVGRGTAFRVHLPLSEQPAPAAPSGDGAPAVGHGEFILLVEDEPAVRQATAHLLTRLGYRTAAAGTAQEAMKLWEGRGGDVDLLLTDMMMPGGVTGLQLAKRLRQAQPALRVLITSGYNDQIMSSDALEEAGFSFLAKPFESQDLALRLRRLFDGE